jgi:hypothetical protein
MGRRWKMQVTVGGLLVLVAGSALVMSLLRPATPPDEGQAIVLAKAHLLKHNEFDYPRGYWARAEWNVTRGTWIVGFLPHSPKHGGYSLAVEVLPDRSCRSVSPGLSFFDVW